jgi:hypothetical protein
LESVLDKIAPLNQLQVPMLIIGGRTSARRKPYRNDTRKPSNRTRSKRIYKHKAIVKCKQGIDKQLLNVEVID